MPEPPAKGRRKGREGRAPRKPRGAPRERSHATDPLEATLRAWRASEAKRRRVPAFRIFNDRTLLAIVAARPKGEGELLAVTGIGQALFRSYGGVLLALVNRALPEAPSPR